MISKSFFFQPHSPSRAHLEERVFGPIALFVGLVLLSIGVAVTYTRFRKAKDEGLHKSYMARAASALSRRASLTAEVRDTRNRLENVPTFIESSFHKLIDKREVLSLFA